MIQYIKLRGYSNRKRTRNRTFKIESKEKGGKIEHMKEKERERGKRKKPRPSHSFLSLSLTYREGEAIARSSHSLLNEGEKLIDKG